MIRFTNVNKIYDNGTHAIKGVSFLVDNGEVRLSRRPLRLRQIHHPETAHR